MQLSDLGEFELIRRISRLCPSSSRVVLGIGDDTAAVLPGRKDHLILLTCDSVTEKIHFDSSATPYQIGWKAMARNLSDIAAMGGRPLYSLVAACFPRHIPLSKALGIQRGLAAAARRFGVAMIGGDTSRSSHGIHLTVCLVGEVRRSEMIRRSGARQGDILCVTGTLGAGLLGKHLCFQPRLREAQFIARRFRPSAMMDLSDGLASDLHRMTGQSRVGFEILAEALPISHALRSRRFSRNREIHHALCDGEDYELLFTLSPKRFRLLQTAWAEKFRLKLTQIGIVRPRSFGIKMFENSKSRTIRPFPAPANDHLRT